MIVLRRYKFLFFVCACPLQFKGRELRGIGQTGHVGVEGMESNHWVVLDIGKVSLYTSLVAYQVGANSGFNSMKRLEV